MSYQAIPSDGYTVYSVTSDVTDYDIPISGQGDWEVIYNIVGPSGAEYHARCNGLTTNQTSCSFINNGAAVTPIPHATELYMNDVSSGLQAWGRLEISNFAGKSHSYTCNAFRKTTVPAFAMEKTDGAWDATTDLTSLTIHSTTASGVKTGSWFAVKKK